MKLRLPRRRIWRVSIYLISLPLIFLAFDLILMEYRRSYTPGYFTTRIQAPLQPDGFIDYLADIENYFSHGVTPDNNAAPLLLEALGRQALPSNQPPDGITNRLGMPHLPDSGDYFVMFEDFSKTATKPSVNPETNSSDDADPSPLEIAWIKANDLPLAKIQQAALRPRLFIPFFGGYRTRTLLEILLPHLQPLRAVSHAFLLRASMRLNAGDFDGFRQDILTVKRLSRLLAQCPTLVERLVGIAMENAASDALLKAAPKLSSSQARRLIADIAPMPDLRPVTDAIDHGERFMYLDCLQVFSRLGPFQAGQLLNQCLSRPIMPPIAFALIPVPYEDAMRAGNAYYDSLIVALRQPNYPQRLSDTNRLETALNNLHSGGILSRARELASEDFFLLIFMPSLSRIQTRYEIGRTQSKLSQIALALAAYHSDHNSYPKTLSELSPEYLPTIPDDFFNEKPLTYSPKPGGYTLYSVGPNMIDDGGHFKKPSDSIGAAEFVDPTTRDQIPRPSPDDIVASYPR